MALICGKSFDDRQEEGKLQICFVRKLASNSKNKRFRLWATTKQINNIKLCL